MEREPGVVQTQEEDKEPTRRSQRPPKPLTHRMDARKLQALYRESGLMRPELTNQTHRGDKIHAKGRQPNKPKETTRMSTEQTIGPHQGTKPGVGGTQHAVRQHEVVRLGEQAAVYGATGFVVGSFLMLTWKGLTRWLG